MIHCMVVSQSPFPSESAFVFDTLPQNCLLGAADLSTMFAGHEAVIHSYRNVHWSRYTCSKRAVNLHGSRLLNPKAGGMGPPCPIPGSAPATYYSIGFLYISQET